MPEMKYPSSCNNTGSACTLYADSRLCGVEGIRRLAAAVAAALAAFEADDGVDTVGEEEGRVSGGCLAGCEMGRGRGWDVSVVVVPG